MGKSSYEEMSGQKCQWKSPVEVNTVFSFSFATNVLEKPAYSDFRYYPELSSEGVSICQKLL